MTEEMRHEIENLLGIKAYDIYGLTETSGPGVAFECEAQSGMHINEDNFIAEIIDPDTGEVLPEGSKGELVFTSIIKEAFSAEIQNKRYLYSYKREMLMWQNSRQNVQANGQKRRYAHH